MKAATISRILKDAGYPRSEIISSGQAKGWSEPTRGFRCRQGLEEVEVTWLAPYNARLSKVQMVEQLAKLYVTLTKKGYEVEMRLGTLGEYLLVRRRPEE